MWRFRLLACLVVGLLVFSQNAFPSSDATDLPQDLPKTVALAAFKNGLTFVVRQGSVRLQAGVGRVTPIPNATLGTLWLAPGEPGASVDEVIAYHYNVSGERNLASLAELLQANAGKTVTVTYSMNMKEYTGEIVGLSAPEPIAAMAAPGINPESGAGGSRSCASCESPIPIDAHRQEACRFATFFDRQRDSSGRYRLSREVRAATGRAAIQD